MSLANDSLLTAKKFIADQFPECDCVLLLVNKEPCEDGSYDARIVSNVVASEAAGICDRGAKVLQQAAEDNVKAIGPLN